MSGESGKDGESSRTTDSKSNQPGDILARVDLRVNVTIPKQFAFPGKTCTMSPFDIRNMGRSIPMCWFFSSSLNPDELVDSLRKTLIAYPVLSGRYDGKKPPTQFNLSNQGVPVDVCTWHDTSMSAQAAAHHLPYTPHQTQTSEFFIQSHTPFVPDKKGMDPDAANPDAPLLKVKIISYPAGGTSVGILVQHGVCDAESAIQFMIQWSRIHKSQGFSPVPMHDRAEYLETLDHSNVLFGGPGEPPAGSLMTNVPAGASPSPPAFARHMNSIMGDPAQARAVIVPCPRLICTNWKAAANAGLADGAFVSTDDIVSARCWQALCSMRCQQLGVSMDSQDIVTTCNRAWNFRKRISPPLPEGYCGNAVSGVFTQMTVGSLLAMSPAKVALKLRSSLQKTSSHDVAARGKWIQARMKEGGTPKQIWDEHAFTFIISSWNFPWEEVDFAGSTPICFDHGAIVPVVAVLVPRAKKDGLNVYASGPNDGSLQTFVNTLTS